MAKTPPSENQFRIETVLSTIAHWRENDEKIVFTNGVFDLIHPGHVAYLKEAKSLGTKLIVGLNSDTSAKSLEKGIHRPINDQLARALVLNAIRWVDAVAIFEDPTPLELIKMIRPHVLVKGGDYNINQIVGASEVLASGGCVKKLSFLEGYSTTAIEQKIMKASLKHP